MEGRICYFFVNEHEIDQLSLVTSALDSIISVLDNNGSCSLTKYSFKLIFFLTKGVIIKESYNIYYYCSILYDSIKEVPSGQRSLNSDHCLAFDGYNQ